MIGSLWNMLGTPQANNIVTVNTESRSSLSNHLRNRSHPTSNSTTNFEDGSQNPSPNDSGDLSAISPLKMTRDNSMSNSSSCYSENDQNVSLFLKHNINSVNLDDPGTQKIALQYLLEKVRDIETLLIDSVKENRVLKEEISALYSQNDSLAAENVTLKDLVSTQGKEHRLLSNEMVCLKEVLSSEKERFENFLRYNNTKFARDIDAIQDDIDYLGDLVPIIKDLEVESAQTREELVRLDKEIVITNQYNRRQNLVIDGIPDNIPQNKLENICLDIIHRIGFLPVGNYEVVGCHRLRRREGDVTTPTIIRFANRKITEYCIKNRWKLKNLRSSWNLAFREDLCDSNLAILAECEKLKSEGALAKVYTHNGFVKVAKRVNGRPIKVAHFSEINAILSGD